jgi:hypothetical protein
MPTIPAFHTHSALYEPRHRRVYHDTNDCLDGQMIDKKHRIAGTATNSYGWSARTLAQYRLYEFAPVLALLRPWLKREKTKG